jgi:hypothetical protein
VLMRSRVDPNGAHTVLAHEFTYTLTSQWHLDGNYSPILTCVVSYQLPGQGDAPFVGKHILPSNRV